MPADPKRKGWKAAAYGLLASGFVMALVATLLLTMKKGPPAVGWVLLVVGFTDLMLGAVFFALANRE
jgi:hypothetical protein